MNIEMTQFMTGQFGFFDAGTSEPSSLSLWFQLNALGTPFELQISWDRANKGATSVNVNTPQSLLLPRHRTWSGGLLFTLPDAQL
jgi:hypothetical protein